MPTLQDEQPEFDRAICDAMIVSTPEAWRSIELRLIRSADATAIGEFSHELISPEGFPPLIPDETLYEATYRLDDLFRRYDGMFRTAVYLVELKEDSWRYSATFEYDHVATGTDIQK